MSRQQTKINELQEVENLIELLQKRINKFKDSKEFEDLEKGYVLYQTRHWASVKRVSLELTRALANLRKPCI